MDPLCHLYIYLTCKGHLISNLKPFLLKCLLVTRFNVLYAQSQIKGHMHVQETPQHFLWLLETNVL